MIEYKKIKRIQKLSCLVVCLNKFSASNIEIILICIHLILFILCIMNLFIIPWNTLKDSLEYLRIVILAFIGISLICLFYNFICRKRKKLKFCHYVAAIYASFVGGLLIVLDFFFVLVSLIIVHNKIKGDKQKQLDTTSILAIDIFSLLIIFAILFFWYSEILNLYAQINSADNLKEYIDNKIKFYASQNTKIVNVDYGKKNNFNDDEISDKKLENDDEINNNNKIGINGDKLSDSRNLNNSNKINDGSNSNNYI